MGSVPVGQGVVVCDGVLYLSLCFRDMKEFLFLPIQGEGLFVAVGDRVALLPSLAGPTQAALMYVRTSFFPEPFRSTAPMTFMMVFPQDKQGTETKIPADGRGRGFSCALYMVARLRRRTSGSVTPP